MTTRAAILSLAFLAGCATAARDPGPAAPAPAELRPERWRLPDLHRPGPSDWALAIIGTPFVFAFRVVACTATAVVAAPTAGLLTLTPHPQPGLASLRDGLGQNCGGPYAMPVPVAAGYRSGPDLGYYAARPLEYYPEPGVSYHPAPGDRYYPAPDVRHYPAPDVGGPRPLTPYRAPAAMAP